MKKHKMKFLMLLVCALFLSSSAFAEDIGKFTSLEGKVDVFKMGQGEAVPAVEGQAIFVGDVVRTKRASKAEIMFADNTIIRLADDTRVEIKEYQVDQKKKRINAVINVDRGKIRAIVSRANGKADFTINTPNASGNVKGTDVVVFYQKSSTGVVVVDGRFSAFNLAHPDKVVTVSSGNTSVIPPDEPPQEPRAFLAMEMERHETDTKVVARRKEVARAEGYTEPGQIGATVVKVAGSVLIRSRDAISWHDAKVNEVLGAGDEIETKEDGKIEIKLENGNVINLKPNTKLKLQKLTQDLQTGDYENLLESNIGKIRAQVEKIKGNSKFEIKTPTAVAAVKGTILYLNILPNLTAAYFEGGNGTLNNIISGITKVVTDGNSSSADEQGNTSDPSPPSDEERSEWTEGWEAEGGGEGYSPPGGGEGEGGEEEAGGGAPDTGAGGGDSTPFDDVPITETSLPPTGEEPGEEGGEEEEQPPVVNLSGTASGNFGYFGYFGSFEIDPFSNISATLTTSVTLSPWSGLLTDPETNGKYSVATLTGTYSNPSEQSLWWGDVTGTGGDGGAFEGWTGGSWHSWEGVVSSIYIDPSGMAGNLFGYMSGTNSDGTLSGSGDLFVIPMAETEILPANLSDSLDNNGAGSGNRYISFLDVDGYLNVDFAREMMRIRGESWGIWREIYSGTYDRPVGTSDWTGVEAGDFNEVGYFFSAFQGTDNNLNSSLRVDVAGAYLDYTKLGGYYGTMLGTYSEGGFFDFEGIGLGAFVEEALSSSGQLHNYIYSDYWGWGYLYGLIGTVGELWNSESFDLVSIGEFENYGDEPFTWFSGGDTLYSYNRSTEPYTYTTYDGGAFYGMTGGIGGDNVLKGMAKALYIDPDGNAGILSGDLNGVYSNWIGYLLNGELTKTQMASAEDVGVAPGDLYDSVWPNYGYGRLAGSFNGNGEIIGWDNFTTMSIVNYEREVAQNWGIYGQTFNGEFSGRNSNTTWSGMMGGYDPFGAYDPYIDYAEGGYSIYDNGSYAGYYQYLCYPHDDGGSVLYFDNYGNFQSSVFYDSNGTYYVYDSAGNIIDIGTWYPDTESVLDYVTAPPEGRTSTLVYKYNDTTGSDDYGYWIADITNGIWSSISAQLHGRFLTYTKMGTIDGEILGTYNDYGGYGDWQAVGLGTWEGEPLTLSGYWGEEGGSLYNDYGDGYVSLVGEEYGLIGSTTVQWWNSASFPILAMGKYYVSESAEEPFIWNTQINSYNAIEGNSTTLDGGAFYGYTAGIWNSQIMDGAVAALYIDPSGNAGILRGNVSGSYYPDIEMWMAEGILTPTEMAQDIGISPEDLGDDKDSGYLDAYVYGDFFGDGEIEGWIAYNYDYGYYYGDTYFIVDDDGNSQNWGIYDLKLEGSDSYSNPTNSKLWMATIDGGGEFGYNNSQGIMSGDLFGVYYDGPPNLSDGNGTWIATSIGEWRGYYIEDGLSEDDGEYYGFIGGLWDNEAIIGKMVALYSQTPYGYEIDDDGEPFSGSGLSGFADTGNLSVTNINGIDPDLGQPWGIWKFDVAGGYDANTPAPFKLTVGGGPNEEGYWLGIIAGIEKPESDIILGAFRGIWLDAGEIHGGLYRGDVFGSTDTDTWQGVGLGEWQTQVWQGNTDTLIPLENLDKTLSYFLTNYIDSEPIIGLGTGNFQGGGSSGTFDVNGDNLSLDEQNWGIYYLSLGGEYNNLDIRKIWSGVVGGSDIDETGEAEAYWLVHTSGIWEDNGIRGIARGTVLSDTNLGSIEGDIFGLYNENGAELGTWDAVTVGSWNEEPLKFVGNVENFYSDSGYGTFFNFDFDVNGEPVFEEVGTIDGLLGSTQSLWTGSASTLFMGEYSLDDEDPSHLWGADIYSYNYDDDTYTTYDGGAYVGMILGTHRNPIEGLAIAFYVDPDGNAGYISGNLDGETYSELGMFEMDGTLTTKQMAEDVDISPDELFDAEVEEGLLVGSGLGSFEGGGTIDGVLGGMTFNLPEQYWGVWMAVSTGTWSEPTSPWNLALGGVSLDEFTEIDGYWLGTVKGADWSNGRLVGEFRGVFFGPNFDEAVLTSFDAGSVTGDVIGVYDEVDTTWQAASAGEWVELAELDPGILGFDNVALAAMVDVPITETYTALIGQTGSSVTGGIISDMTMDISFYTGASQQIWAALLSGNYGGTPADGWSVDLSGNGYTTDLTSGTWSTADNGWTATVNGTGPDNLSFSGQAGGTYTATGTEGGTLEGVGAGTWTQGQ